MSARRRKFWCRPRIMSSVEHPNHYNSHPSGVECIEIIEHMNFCRGAAMKYLWRAGLKDDAVEDLRKAIWYINREIQRLEKELHKNAGLGPGAGV